MKSKDRRHWILPPGAIQANQAMMEYVLERSVALLLVEDQDRFFIASSVCIRIANRYLLATAGHNLEKISTPNQIRLLPQGRRGFGDQAVVSFYTSSNHDVGLLEVPESYVIEKKIKYLQMTDLRLRQGHGADVAFMICGFPSEELIIHSTDDLEPVPLGLLTSSVNESDKANRLILQYPPQSQLDKGLELVKPHGLSGCGVWSYPPFTTNPIWVPNKSQLLAIASSWKQAKNQEIAEPMDYWLDLVALNIPELKGMINEYIV